MKFINPPDFVVLLVLDGWGLAAPGPGNAISLANTINMDRLWASYPHTQLAASGKEVGLPAEEAGNTETGHLNIGAGRIVYQDLVRINNAIADGSIYKNQVLIGAIENAIKNKTNLHFMGLIGASGIHSSMGHLYALIELAKRMSFDRLFIHIFTDGRDSSPTSANIYISELQSVLNKAGIGKIASIMGRYWAMDRDFRWDRTAKAYFALTKAEGLLVKTPQEAVELSYSEGKTDEFIEPSLITNKEGKPTALISKGDSVIFFNFRIDRPRQLTSAFIFDDFRSSNISFDFDPYLAKYEKKHAAGVVSKKSTFERGNKINDLFFITMTQYSKTLSKQGAHVAFPPEIVDMPVGRVISEAGLKQLRASESEKERFVTFYFNGQNENPFEGEDRLIVSSPKVATYDLKPEMSARELTQSVLSKLKDNQAYKFILINYANPDMVGHTGSIGASVKACEVVDECVGKLSSWVLAYNGALLIIGDHGNVEQMINPQTGEIDTEHNSSPVPFIAVTKELIGKPQVLISGILADIAPTILKILDIPIPPDMTGRDLLSGF
ncbi:2,3-bisphosphoglycerate-independent phosphoglycerate mutase [Patescibacteria group bacterium]